MALLPLAEAAGRSDLLARAIVFGALGSVVALLVYVASVFWLRRKDPMPDDDSWKAGVFYWDPDDPAVFVPKRLGLGYTLNFARPAAWVALGMLLGGPLLVLGALLFLD